MKPAAMTASDRVRALKQAFDQSFSAPRRPDAGLREGFLKIRVSGDAYAVRLNDISALASRLRIVPLASRRPEFLGMAGHRGTLVALFSLSALLGTGGGRTPARWTVLLREAPRIGLAFEAYEGFAWIDAAGVRSLGEAPRRKHVVQAVEHEGVQRLIIDISGLFKSLSRQ